MAIRNDVTIDWGVSPRIITVLAPAVELNTKDLYDTLRSLESKSNAMDNLQIVDAGGFESLGGGVVVGLTVTLRNALVAFEARAGADFIQCSISGGNLVALQSDLVTYFITPVLPTAFTQVVMANSSSATQSDLAAIQYSSYQNGVWVDENSNTSGTDYPSGTREHPVNNAVDAVAIGSLKGFDTMFILGDYNFVTGDNISGISIEGQNAIKSAIYISDGAVAALLQISTATVSGVLDGGSTLRECVVNDIGYINGYMYQCVLGGGTVVLGGNATGILVDCYSGVAGSATPFIDLGGAGQSLAIRGYSGGVTLCNKSGIDQVSIDLHSGQVVLDNTVTNGLIIVRGDGKLIDTNGDHILSGNWNGATILNETTSVMHETTLSFMEKLLTFKQFIGLS